MTDERRLCLELAVRACGHIGAESVVGAAEQFYAFLTRSGAPSTAGFVRPPDPTLLTPPPVPSDPPSEPFRPPFA
jgi:hypothetical protein